MNVIDLNERRLERLRAEGRLAEAPCPSVTDPEAFNRALEFRMKLKTGLAPTEERDDED